MRPARRHHFISQFYLRHFVDPTTSRLFVVDLNERKTFETSTNNVALENDFHTITVPGQPPDAIEKRLAELEGSIAPALAQVTERGYVGDDDAGHAVLFFATLLLVKNPAMRKTVEGFADEIMRRVTQMTASDPVAWNARVQEMIADGTFNADEDFDGLREAILKGDYTLSLSPEAHMDREFQNATDLMPYVVERHWNFFRATAGQFVTCDRPAVLMWADPTRTDPIGLGLRNTRFLFALSSTAAICGGFELADELIELDADDVSRVNGRIVLNARRFVYARSGDFQYALAHNGGPRCGAELPRDTMLDDRENGEPKRT